RGALAASWTASGIGRAAYRPPDPGRGRRGVTASIGSEPVTGGAQRRADSGAPRRPRRSRQHIPLPPGGRSGPPAPWYDLATGELRYDTSDVLDAFADKGPPAQSLREVVPGRPGAAVLAAIYDNEDGEAWVILTRRTLALRAHSGEVSFPGGRQELGE